jgi:perosamine synthetase
MKEKAINELPLMETGEGIVLFHPHIPKKAIANVTKVLKTRWIGQGPRVAEFETEFAQRFAGKGTALAVGSGTDALHLAYILAGLQPGDEVITPVFTCTATNIPFLYMGVKIVFADIEPDTLNIDINHVRKLITPKTKAIVCVHYGGLPCDMDELWEIGKQHNIRIIEDAAHALGATYKGKYIGEVSDFVMYSFQAIKHLTTGDGGMLVVQCPKLVEKGKRVRWFGIDRAAKQNGIWENDITEIGYKYQMTDISAAIGLAGLEEFDAMLAHRKKLWAAYKKELKNMAGIQLIGINYTDRKHAAWLCTVIVENRERLMQKLRAHGIESSQVHYRNDRYSIFGGRLEGAFPNMDSLEDNYLVLPLHTKMKVKDVTRICKVLAEGW